MIRTATVAFTHYASDGRVRRMAEALAERGDNVTAITLRDQGEPKSYHLAGVKVRTINLKQHRGSNQLLYVTQYLAFMFITSWILLVAHVKRRFDVVHINNMPNFMVFAAVPIKILGAKVILDIHDPMPELFESKFGAGKGQAAVRFIGWVEQVSIRFADRVISVHQIQLDTFTSRGADPERFTIVQNVADPKYFPVGRALETERDPDAVRLVYHGTMAPRLGLDILLRAVDACRHVVPGLHLLLIGDGDDTPRLLALIEELEIDDIVTFEPGFVPVEDLLPHLVASDIGVVPANVNPFTRNMLPVKLLEYVTLGIPSISTDLPSIRYYFEPTEVTLVEPGSVELLASAIEALALDPELREKQAREALQFTQRHSWEGERDRYLDLMDSLAAGRADG
ncbi:MAG: glycosyltransferase family 4 protein [Acidimicrobiia bacterium]